LANSWRQPQRACCVLIRDNEFTLLGERRNPPETAIARLFSEAAFEVKPARLSEVEGEGLPLSLL
jgi:hypothetical protein